MVLSDYEDSATPIVSIFGYIDENNVIFEHRGGNSLTKDTIIQVTIGGNITRINVTTPHLTDSNSNQKWDVGEKIVYPADVNGLQIEAIIKNQTSNTALFHGTLQKGNKQGLHHNMNWWNASWTYRRNINITTGPNTPYHNYDGYTVQWTLDTTGNKFQDNGHDIRVIYEINNTFIELDREIVNPNTHNTEIRFCLQQNISENSYDNHYSMYYGNPLAQDGPSNKSNIYVWYDSGQSDNEHLYTQGRIDSSCHGGKWGNTVTWDTLGYYVFNTGDNYADSIRPSPIIERDVYIEYEHYQTNAYPNDMTSGPIVRWVGSGSGSNEDSNHWFFYEMADSSFRSGKYSSHDDITADNRGFVQIAHGFLGVFPQGNWTRIGLAVWDTGPSHLKAFYNNESGGWNGYRFNGTANDNTQPGQFGIWLQQDKGRIRNILARRYSEPEPVLILGSEKEI